VDAERARLTREIGRIRAEVGKCAGKLANPGFVDRAPPQVVEQERRRLDEWNAKLGQLDAMLAALS
jgi:valyl-tRNA synthetase